jgi:hypothetical protein
VAWPLHFARLTSNQQFLDGNITSGASRRDRKDRDVSNAESLVVVKLDHNGGQAPVVFEVLEQAGLLGEVSESELDLVEPGAVGFRIPRDRMAAVVLALECSGFSDVRAYEVETSGEKSG